MAPSTLRFWLLGCRARCWQPGNCTPFRGVEFNSVLDIDTVRHAIVLPAAGYSAAYAQLHNAHRPERDPLPEVPDAKKFLAQQLAVAASRQPGQLPGRISAALPPEGQAALQGLLQSAGVTLS